MHQYSTLCCMSFWSILLVQIENCQYFRHFLLVWSKSLMKPSTCWRNSIYLLVDEGNNSVIPIMWSLTFSMLSCKICQYHSYAFLCPYPVLKSFHQPSFLYFLISGKWHHLNIQSANIFEHRCANPSYSYWEYSNK